MKEFILINVYRNSFPVGRSKFEIIDKQKSMEYRENYNRRQTEKIQRKRSEMRKRNSKIQKILLNGYKDSKNKEQRKNGIQVLSKNKDGVG